MFRRDNHWKFTSTFDPARRAFLEDAPPWEVIVDNLCRGAILEREPGVEKGKNPRLAGWNRARAEYTVGSDDLDLFFNGPTGLRSQYRLSDKLGREATLYAVGRFIERVIKPKILEANLTTSFLLQSLSLPSAKIWIDEKRVKSSGEYLDIDEWVRKASKPFARKNGIRVFSGNGLCLMGGWIDSSGKEQIAIEKRDRDLVIHCKGYS